MRIWNKVASCLHNPEESSENDRVFGPCLSDPDSWMLLTLFDRIPAFDNGRGTAE